MIFCGVIAKVVIDKVEDIGEVEVFFVAGDHLEDLVGGVAFIVSSVVAKSAVMGAAAGGR